MLAHMVKREIVVFSKSQNWPICFTMVPYYHLQCNSPTLNLFYRMFWLVMTHSDYILTWWNRIKEEMLLLKKGVFNYRLCRARRTSENAFGILDKVFQIFYTPICLKPTTVDDVIIVSCCLHNLMREWYWYLSTNGLSNYDFDSSQELPTNNLIPLRRTDGYANTEGFTVRDSFASYFTEEGKVPWQDSTVCRTDKS